jgi:hypothetical protein
VAIVDHELPVANDTMQQTIQAANKNIVGFKIFKP